MNPQYIFLAACTETIGWFYHRNHQSCFLSENQMVSNFMNSRASSKAKTKSRKSSRRSFSISSGHAAATGAAATATATGTAAAATGKDQLSVEFDFWSSLPGHRL